MADFTDTLTYTVSLNGETYSDTITETISSVTEVLHHSIHAIASTLSTKLIEPDTLTGSGSELEFDAVYLLVVNKDATQSLTLEMIGTDSVFFKIPPLGFMKFNWDGNGTYSQETLTTSTQTTFTNVDNIYGNFESHGGLVEVIAIST